MKATLVTKQMCNFNSLSDKPKAIDVTAHSENLKNQLIG